MLDRARELQRRRACSRELLTLMTFFLQWTPLSKRLVPFTAVTMVVVATTCCACGPPHEDVAPVVLVPVSEQQHTAVVISPSPSTSPSRRDSARIQVLPIKRPDRPAEVIGIVDAHVAMGDHDRAMSVLREKAAEMGADAVIGVDFQHGEGHRDEPIHLSGLAIRYLNE